MKKIVILSLMCVFGLTFSTQAQNSQQILDDLSKKAKSYSTIKADYASTLEDKQSGMDPIIQTGSIKVKGQKYRLGLGNYEVISDGVNLWTYDKETNTCSIDLVEDMDSDLFDPSKLFTIWENDFKNKYVGTENVRGVDCDVIDLFPNDAKEMKFHTISVFVDKKKKEVKKIIAKGKDGTIMTYELKTFVTNEPMAETTFEFSKSNYPGVETEDNR